MIHMSQVKVSLEALIKNVSPEALHKGIIEENETELVKKSAAKLLKIRVDEIKKFVIEKKSMDARKKNQIQYIYRVTLHCDNEKKRVKQYGKNDVQWEVDACETVSTEKICYQSKEKIVVVGFGPAGMFAALELAKAGLCPVVIERGMEVDKRQKEVDNFWNGGKLNPESNVQFGEGGAGTFSDGKLNTLVKDPSGRNKKVLKTFVEFGAPGEILYLQKPHIGTDELKGVVKAIRKEILKLGGEILFETKLEDVIIEDGRVKEILVRQADKVTNMLCNHLILAIGHSARDTFFFMKESGIHMEPKAFALGVRVEHPQEMIGQSQYGDMYPKLPVADYKLTHQTAEKRGVYSFCMCPGGYVVNASSEEGRLAVNGMSYYNRDGVNANSAIVVTVNPEDFGSSDVLAGIAFQRRLEEAAYQEGAGKIPVQLFGDFLQNRTSTGFGGIIPQMKGQYAFGNVRGILPEFVGNAIAEGILSFDRRIRGYGREDAILSGIESRTSSPVRIVRDERLEANIAGIYPCGEGAGYAGGITSAAMDGIRVADQIKSQKVK